MKNVFKIFIVLAVSVFFSCNNFISEEDDKCYLKIQSHASYRTILPENVEVSSLESLELKGIYKGQEKALASWASYSEMVSSDALLCDGGIWDFELTAKLNGKLAYKGFIKEKEIITGVNNLVFALEEVKEATGSFEVKLVFPNDEQVKAVKAGLFYEDGTVVSGFESKKIDITEDEISGKKSVCYASDNVPVGNFFVKFYFYRDVNCLEVIQSPYVELIRISPSQNSSAIREILSFEHMYTITYELNGGKWREGYTPALSFNEYENVYLPTEENIGKENCLFYGWYTDPEYSEKTKIEGWDNGTQTTSKTVYAKWKYDINKLPEVIAACADEGEYEFEVGGDYEGSGGRIRTELKKFVNAKFSLDFSCVNNWTTFASGLFDRCNSLKEVNIPEGVIWIQDYAFGDCINLMSVSIPESVRRIERDAFYGTRSIEVYYDGTIYDWFKVNKYQLWGFESLSMMDKEVKYYFKNKSIGNSIKIENVEEIGEYAFEYCKELEHIDICEGVLSIGEYAFYKSNLQGDIILPSTLEKIETHAFLGLHFDSVTLLSKVPPEIEYVYNPTIDCQLGYSKFIYVPKGCAEVYKTTPGYTGYADKIFELEE